MFHYLKFYNQSKNKLGVSYKENLPEIKFQIYTWLEEEIEFLSRKKELTRKIEHRNENNGNQNKIHLDLSVAQLAYAINLLIKIGLIKNNNLKEVLHIATELFKTDMTETISFDSLRSKYYNVETSTTEAVKVKIENLLNFMKL